MNKLLVLHNNTLPIELRKEKSFQLSDSLDVRSYMLGFIIGSESVSFDSFVSKRLNEIFRDNHFDLIILPYSFSLDNYYEYTGLQIAAHIRLTKEWGHLSTPILFVGPDSPVEILQFSCFGSLLFSYSVFTTKKREINEIIAVIHSVLSNHKSSLSEDQILQSDAYKHFVKNLNIAPPPSFDTHHSVANEWALFRWNEMLFDEESYGDQAPAILESLYFKYLTSSAINEHFTKNWKKRHLITARIDGIAGKRIAYIDDESKKGWSRLLSTIFCASGAELVTYDYQIKPKNELLDDIKSFVDKESVDCYIVDLRLHETDFLLKTKPEDLTGSQIIDYIKKKNKGSQIVVFTASNKTWNYEYAIRSGALGYVVKESPEYNYSRNDSYENFVNFIRLIKNSISRSYIANYVQILDKVKDLEMPLWKTLDNFVDMLMLFDERKSCKYNILNLAVFVESYITGKFYLEGDKLVLISTLKEVLSFSKSKVHFSSKEMMVRFFEKDIAQNPPFYYIDVSQRLSVITIALYYFYNINEDYINQFLRLWKERDSKVAHHGGEPEMTIKEVLSVFDNVVLPVLNKDFKVNE